MALRRSGFTQSPYVHGALAALILMILTFVNGYSFFFNDSKSYIHGPVIALKFATGVDLGKEWPDTEITRAGAATASAGSSEVKKSQSTSDIRKDHAYTINRSIYYGALAYAGYALSDFWLTAYVQAYCVAVPIALLWLGCLGLSRKTYYLAVLILSLLTSVGAEVGLIMPDVFAGILILGAATLVVYWPDLRTFDKVFLTCVLSFAAMIHGTHIVILLAMIVLMALLGFLVPSLRGRWASIAACSLAVVIGLLGMKAFDKAMEVATGHKTLVMPHVTASLIYKGPGYDYLLAKCPQVGLEICKDLSRLPQATDVFLGDSKNGVFMSADLATQVRLSQEQTRFAIGVLEYDPLGVAAGILKAGLQQAVLFPVDSLKVTPEMAYNYKTGMPAHVADKITSSTIARVPQVMDFVTLSTYITAAIGAIMVAYFLYALARPADARTRLLLIFNWTVIAGLVINAFVCGGINTPIDRYGSRVIWLLPLLALVDLAFRRAAVRSAQGAAASPGAVKVAAA